jgi:predicted permease
MLWKDLRYGLRFLRHSPGFALAAILTLALGIGANTAIFSFVNTLLLRPLPFPEPDRLVRIYSVRGSEAGKLMPREWEDLDRDRSVFDGVAAWYPSQYNISAGGPPEVVRACMTTANLFRVLGVRLVHGSSWEEGAQRARNPATVLNYELWRKRFGGDTAIVGKSMTLDNSPYMVVGIAEPGFQFPVRSDVFRAAYLGGAQNNNVRSLFAVARLKRGVTIKHAQERLNAFAAEQERVYPETNRGIRFRMMTLREAYVGEVRPYLVLTLSLAGLVLLIACANVVNLLLSRGVTRRKEIAVRVALGASYGRIVRQLLGEAALITLAGAIAGLALAVWWMRLLRTMLRVELPAWMKIEIDGAVLLFAIGVSVICGVLAGLAPALSAAHTDLQDAFRDTSRGSSGGATQVGFRRALIAGELALAVTLLILGLLIIYEGIRRLVEPPAVEGGVVLVVALLGVVVNIAATVVLHGADRRSLNVEGAFQHVLTDLVAFIATAIAGLVILLTGFDRADGIASLFVAAVMLRAAWGLLRDSGRIFLEAAPKGVDVAALGAAMVAVPGITEVHDLHVWEVTSGFPALSAHVLVGREDDCHRARAELETVLHERFGIEHTTLQVEHEGGGLLEIEMRG